jgi:hypothetical protein
MIRSVPQQVEAEVSYLGRARPDHAALDDLKQGDLGIDVCVEESVQLCLLRGS